MVFCFASLNCLKALIKKRTGNLSVSGFFLVEVAGFEPAAFWSRTKRATKLRYTSIPGANEGTRTPGLLITNQLLYQLSYIGISAQIIIANVPSFVQYFQGTFSKTWAVFLAKAPIAWYTNDVCGHSVF